MSETPRTDKHEVLNGGAYGHDLAREFERALAELVDAIQAKDGKLRLANAIGNAERVLGRRP